MDVENIPKLYELADERTQLLNLLREMNKTDYCFWRFMTNGMYGDGCNIPKSIKEEIKDVVKKRLKEVELEIEKL